jgi:Cdc6-like AAA superfamily ATPase
VIADPAARTCEADGWRVPPVRLLPSVLDHDDLLAQAASSVPVLGVDEERLEPVALDLAAAHLLVLGEPGSGKTAVRLLCRELARTEPGAEVVCSIRAAPGCNPSRRCSPPGLRRRLDGGG